ncbi:helix-turn-helix domain-containing protein [Winogradskyella sp.]|uniref:helix-turn-helix domain-containing protein n=1 Tax=Winogradskyella sp. TaxID=1883156 RepID=UPI003BACA41C
MKDVLSDIRPPIALRKGEFLAPQYKTTEYEGLSIGTTEYASSVDTGIWHFHENAMLSFVLYGRNVEHKGYGSELRTMGSINFYHAFEPHKNDYIEFPSKHISVEIEKDFLKKYDYTESDLEQAVHKSRLPSLTFLKLLRELSIRDDDSNEASFMIFTEFIEQALNGYDLEKVPDWMHKIKEVLNDRWDEHISLEELSNISNIHPTNISKYFRTYFQCTYGVYRRQLKVARATEYLRTNRYSLTEIAYLCGFSDQSHFTRTFRAMTGYRPKDYIKL